MINAPVVCRSFRAPAFYILTQGLKPWAKIWRHCVANAPKAPKASAQGRVQSKCLLQKTRPEPDLA